MSAGHLTADNEIEINVPTGPPVGTTGEAAFSTSSGHPDSSGYSTASVERDCNNSTEEADLFIEDNLNLSIEYVYELLTT